MGIWPVYGMNGWLPHLDYVNGFLISRLRACREGGMWFEDRRFDKVVLEVFRTGDSWEVRKPR